MRTSIDLDDSLLTRSKLAAARAGITLRELFERALREFLDPARVAKPYVLELGVSRGERRPDVPYDDWNALKEHIRRLDEEDGR